MKDNKFTRKLLEKAKDVELYQYDRMILNEYMEQKQIRFNKESYHSFLLDLYNNKGEGLKLTLGEFKRLYSLTK